MYFFYLVLTAVHSKTLHESYYLTDESPAQYVTKFGVDVGTGTWELRVRLNRGTKDYKSQDSHSIHLLLYRDRDFDPSAFQCASQELAVRHDISVPKDGKWSDKFAGPLGEPNSPHIWFFVIADCERILGRNSKVKVELEILGEDGSPLPVEFKGMKLIYVLVCVLLCAMWGRNLWKLYEFFTSNTEIESNIVMLNVAIGLEFFSLVCKVIHIASYESNGRGIGAFDFIGNSTGFVSELIMMLLLLAISDGWTLNYREFPLPEIYFPVIIVVSLLQLVISAMGRASSDAYYLFSEYEGAVGWCIVVQRLALLTWIVYNASHLYKTLPSTSILLGKQMTLIGVLYIVSTPLLMGLVRFLPPYNRHKAIVAGSMVIHGVTMAGFSYLFTTKSAYYRVSTMSSSILPVSKSHRS